MQAFAPLAYVLAFIAVVILIQTASGLVFANRDRTRKINRRLTMLESGQTPEQVYSSLVRGTAAPGIDNRRLLDLYHSVDRYLRQGGLTITPLRLLAITVAAAGVMWIGSLLLVQTGRGPSLLTNGATSLVGACAVSLMGAWLWVRRKRNKRLKHIEEQLPLALDIMNRALRAGHPVVSAVQLAASEMGDPLGTEFGLVVDETTYGGEFKEALVNFALRTGSPDAHYFAVAVGIQSETGGNLAEILEGLNKVIRGRNTLGKRVKALASEGKASAYLLSALPPLLVGFEFMTNPKYYTDHFADPIFWPAVTVVLVLYVIGWLMISRIINFKY